MKNHLPVQNINAFAHRKLITLQTASSIILLLCYQYASCHTIDKVKTDPAIGAQTVIGHQHLYPQGIESVSKFFTDGKTQTPQETTTVCYWKSSDELDKNGRRYSRTPHPRNPTHDHTNDSFHQLTLCTQEKDPISLYIMAVQGRDQYHDVIISKINKHVKIQGPNVVYISEQNNSGEWIFKKNGNPTPLDSITIEGCGTLPDSQASVGGEYFISIMDPAQHHSGSNCGDLNVYHRTCEMEIISRRTYYGKRHKYGDNPPSPIHETLPPPGGSASGGNN